MKIFGPSGSPLAAIQSVYSNKVPYFNKPKKQREKLHKPEKNFAITSTRKVQKSKERRESGKRFLASGHERIEASSRMLKKAKFHKLICTAGVIKRGTAHFFFLE